MMMQVLGLRGKHGCEGGEIPTWCWRDVPSPKHVMGRRRRRFRIIPFPKLLRLAASPCRSVGVVREWVLKDKKAKAERFLKAELRSTGGEVPFLATVHLIGYINRV